MGTLAELPAPRLASVVRAGYRLVSVAFLLMPDGGMLTPRVISFWLYVCQA